MADPDSDSEATFVIIHAMGNDIDCWQAYPHFWRFLRREGAVPWVLPGDTGRPREKGWTVEGMADEIVAGFEGPLDLMGFANGGVIIQSLLERHNERVRSAIIVNARFASASSAATRPPIDMTGAAPPMADLIDAGLQRWFSPFAVRCNAPGVVEARREFLRMDAEAYRDFQYAAGSFALRDNDSLRRAQQPISLIAGLDDMTLAAMLELHRVLPMSRLELVPGRHFLHLEHPDSIMSAIYHHRIWQPIAKRVEEPLYFSTLGQVGEWSAPDKSVVPQ
ncbi:MAG: pimeloyl-ACP methyl ester carboxylesterase [Gammaproteobacteria bacterium]|jgi:pimeloyl-ACP methyl ester carboxylesterase